MDLLERYLQAVRFFLPRNNQDDIVRELSENLISQMEDREEELRRPLNEDERADILRRHGHPMVVAGRYRSHQQLIGPLFLPIYLFALKVGLGVAFIVTMVVAVVATALHGDVGRHLLEAFLHYPGRALMVFAWTTLGFAALDFAQSRLKLTHKWDPRTLPKLVRHEERISRANSLCEFLAALGATVWLLLVPQSPFLLMGPAAAIFQLAPIWGLVYLPIVGVTVGTAALSLVNFVRPFWTPARSLARLAIHTTFCIVCIVLMRSDPYLLAKSSAALSDGTSMDRVVEIANRSVEIGILVALIINLIEIAREIHRWQSRRKLSSASGSGAAHVTR
jgi:hypothetical protein